MTCLEVFPCRVTAELLTEGPLRRKLTKQTIMKGGRYDTFANNGAAVFSLTVDVYPPWDLQWHGEWRDALTAGRGSGLRETDELWTLLDIPGTSSQSYPHDNNTNTRDCYCIAPSWGSHWSRRTLGVLVDLMPVAKARHVCTLLH